MNKKRVTIAIAAYNSEVNIRNLLLSLIGQQEIHYILEKIMVHSDASGDKTVAAAQSLKDNRIHVIDSKTRKGFAGSVQSLLLQNTSDIMILLNDDIVITDIGFIEKAIIPFHTHPKTGLSSVSLVPLPTKNFIENAVKTGYMAYANFAQHYQKGNNILTCDGKVLALSGEFAKSIVFPESMEQVENLDTYLFALAKKNHFEYHFAKTSYVSFRSPSTITDFVKWQKTNYHNKKIIKSIFSEIDEEYKLPKIPILYFKLIELLKNPAGGSLIFLLGSYCSLLTTLYKSSFNSQWDVVYTTKSVNEIT